MSSESPRIALRKRAASIIAAFAMVTLVVAKLIAHYSPATAFKVASGLVSHQICSSTFVSHQNPDEAFGRISPTLGPLSWVATYDIDYQQSVVSARIAGLAYSRAIYRQAEGCLVQIGAPPAAPAVVSPSKGSRGIIPNAGPRTALVKPINLALAIAIDQQFDEPNHPPHRWTTAIVVVKDGRIVGERYGNGAGVETPLLGWSMSKSIINGLIGILVQQGRLSTTARAPVPEWADSRDPRNEISIDQLMRMKSGTDFGNSLEAGFASGFDPTKRMLFMKRGMAADAASAKLATAPGTRWTYSDGSYLILSRALRDTVGGDAQSVPLLTGNSSIDLAWSGQSSNSMRPARQSVPAISLQQRATGPD